MGLIMNGLLKVPMQFVILFIGAMVFVFYQYNQPPVFFNENVRQQILKSEYFSEAYFRGYEAAYEVVFIEKRQLVDELNAAIDQDNATAIATAQDELNRL